MNNDFKVGKAAEIARLLSVMSTSDHRERKSLHDLSDQEQEDLIRAFQGIINRAPDDANSYWSITSVHGLPAPSDCVHGSEQFNHWHRLYMLQIENALRSVPGCEHVTLPYWDLMRNTIPALLDQPLFKTYTWPNSEGTYTTSRNSNADILQFFEQARIRINIQEAMTEPWYEDFWIELEDSSHDPGHGSIGGSNRNPDYASFDPIFWFFHCFWDKLVWDWQETRNATTLDSFKDNMRDFTDWLDEDMKSGDVVAKAKDLIDNSQIDLAAIGLGTGMVSISYKRPESVAPEPLRVSSALKSRSISAAATFSLPKRPMASVMLKGVHRLNVNGSFHIQLFAGTEMIATTFEFQFLEPAQCPNCVSKPIRNYKMRVPVSDLEKGPLRVELRRAEDNLLIEMVDVGSPTLNVRMLLD